MASSRFLRILGFFVILLQIESSYSLTCSSQTFTNNKLFDFCNDLPQLGSYLHWTYNSSNSSLAIAFVAPAKSDGWAAWAINPTGSGMLGAQALIAYKLTDGTVTVKTFNISSYQPIAPSDISLKVYEKEGEYSDGLMRIFAKVELPENKTTVNQVWQVGSSVANGIPAIHAMQSANTNSKGTLDILRGHSTSTGGDSRLKKKNIHGVLNAVSWGILFPVGAIIARYLRTFKSADPAWFYLHASCQFSGYVVGVAGWATGIKLGSQSKGIVQTTHRNIGIALFCLATVQIFALFLRPQREHKLRFYWNIYHHGLGYTILVLGIINVFKGLDILDPAKKWKTAYIIVLIVLGGITLVLEVVTWIVVWKRKSDKSTKPYDGINDRH